MTYKLFLDDIRDVNMVYKKLTNDDFVVVRNFNDFKKTIIENGLPELISFDNDLGLDENDIIAEDGYAAAKWLVYESGIDLQNLKNKTIANVLKTPKHSWTGFISILFIMKRRICNIRFIVFCSF